MSIITHIHFHPHPLSWLSIGTRENKHVHSGGLNEIPKTLKSYTYLSVYLLPTDYNFLLVEMSGFAADIDKTWKRIRPGLTEIYSHKDKVQTGRYMSLYT